MNSRRIGLPLKWWIAATFVAVTLPAQDAARDTSDDYTRNVAIVIWNGAEILDWAGPSEVFQSAGRFGSRRGEPAFEVYTVSKTKQPITSQGFVDVLPDYSIAEARRPDVLVLPGGGTSSVLNDPEFLAWAGDAARGAEVALTVCTGAFVLGKAGLLDGKDVTTWYGATDALERQFPAATVHRGRRFVDNGQIVTTAGVSAGIDGSLHVVARLLGRYVADRTAQYMEYRWTPEPYLARDYPVLNPSLDEQGRLAQQAEIHAQEKNWPAAIEAYRAVLAADPGDHGSWFNLGAAQYAAGQYDEAGRSYLKAAEADRWRLRGHYNGACSLALAGRKEPALASLEKAIEAGFTQADHIRQDVDLASLRDDPRFAELVARAGAATP